MSSLDRKPLVPLSKDGAPRAFFGRRAGKRLHKGQDELVRTLLPEIEIILSNEGLDPDRVFSGKARRVLEIGYGGGEHLAQHALAHPEVGYVGCEVFSSSIGKMVSLIAEKSLSNVRLFTDDALKLLSALPDASVDEVFLLYPDPWPKTRHHKRRFISELSLAELARTLIPGGKFHFATDIEDYVNWTLAQVLRSPFFAFSPKMPGNWHSPYPDWSPTRYEQKARAAGRLISWYLSFERLAQPDPALAGGGK